MSRLHAVKPNDRTFFVICGVAGALILLGCALPTFELYLDAALGGGDSQRVFHYYRDLHLGTYREPGARLFMLAGLAFLAIGIFGFMKPRRWLVVVVTAISIVAFVQTVKTVDYARSPGEVGVYSCQEESLGSCLGYLAPAVQELRADILRKPEAKEPEYLGPGPGAFNIRKLGGWQLVGWSVAIFSLLTWFRTVLLVVPSPRKAAVVYGLVLLVVLVSVLGWWWRDFES